jgi:NADH:ubiquinone oxidoreductase subunit H
MLYSFSLFSILEVLLVIVPALLSVAYVTVAERKTMASMQRRVGPNKVGQKIGGGVRSSFGRSVGVNLPQQTIKMREHPKAI